MSNYKDQKDKGLCQSVHGAINKEEQNNAFIKLKRRKEAMLNFKVKEAFRKFGKWLDLETIKQCADVALYFASLEKTESELHLSVMFYKHFNKELKEELVSYGVDARLARNNRYILIIKRARGDNIDINELNQIQGMTEKDIQDKLYMEHVSDIIYHTITKKLTKKRACYIISYFGLDGEGSHTYDELGKLYKTSRQNASQIVTYGIKNLRKHLHGKYSEMLNQGKFLLNEKYMQKYKDFRESTTIVNQEKSL